MKKIIFATGNQDKMREVREIMSDLDAEILSMGEAGIQIDIVEDGVTFQENARIKAAAVARGFAVRPPRHAWPAPPCTTGRNPV